jgi:hypothetical protein
MQQDDFRALLSTPRPRAVDVADRPKPKNALKAGKETPAFKPRDKPSNKWPKPIVYESGNTYTDRAKARRELGEEVRPCIYLNDNLSSSQAVVEHKGLDLAQLLRDQEEAKEQEAEAAEGELDTLLETAAAEDAPMDPPAALPKKRTRAEMLQDLRASHAGPAADADMASNSKFRKISAVKAVPPTEKPKKLKKKKKVAAADVPVEASTSQDQQPSDALPQEQPPASVTPAEALPLPELPPADDDDIFGGAVDYASDSGDEDVPAPAPQAGPSVKRNWFGDDAEDDVHADPIAAPVLPKAVPMVEEEEESGRLKGLEGSGADDIKCKSALAVLCDVLTWRQPGSRRTRRPRSWRSARSGRPRCAQRKVWRRWRGTGTAATSRRRTRCRRCVGSSERRGRLTAHEQKDKLNRDFQEVQRQLERTKKD